MTQDTAALYSAYASRDPRFDGVFYIGITSTGIYCRPVCTAKMPKADNCLFFTSAEAAEKASFRPCLRCRPELAPGTAPVDDAHRVAGLFAARIDEGLPGDASSLEHIAAQFELSSRQIRRIIRKEFGVSPMELLLTRRLLLAKQLLTETTLPVIEVAFASGFSSLRRFNDAFSRRYGMPPGRLRKTASLPEPTAQRKHTTAPIDTVIPRRTASLPEPSPQRKYATAPIDTLTLQLSYRPPFDWPGMLRFLSARALRGVESTHDGAYLRSARLGGRSGWIRVRNAPEKRILQVEITHSLAPVLPALLGRLRHLFDLSARPDVIAAQLMKDALLAGTVALNPGLRVPGAFDGFEMAVRAILGQQITVKAATTLAGRFVEAFGETIATPHPDLTRLCPSPQRIAAATVDELAALGIIRTRAGSIIALAKEVASGRLTLEAGAHPEITMKRLVALPGIGTWTANYVAMRALHWPDAFPSEDIAVRKRLGGVTAARAEDISQAWRPWRSYATLHLWHE